MYKEAAVVVGTGHLGVHLADQLVRQGREVRVLAWNQCNLPPVIKEQEQKQKVKVYSGDVMDPETLYDAFKGAGVIYLAAACISLGRGDDNLWGVNVRGVENVTLAAEQEKVPKVVYFSSIHAMRQEPIDQRLDEKQPLVMTTKSRDYGQSKAAGERLALELMMAGHVQGCILSPTGMIGPMDYGPSEFGCVIKNLMYGRMPILVDAGMDWVGVEQVATAALVAEEKAGNGEKFILSGHYVHMRETAVAVAEAAGVAPPKLFIPLRMAELFAPIALKWALLTHQRALFTPYSMEALRGNQHISHEKATEKLGFLPRPHAETVGGAVRWFKENGMEI